jgi:preprotein translocase subunit SecY
MIQTGTPMILNYITVVLCLTAGTALIIWIGERITENGVGNGISLLIFISIISRLPVETIKIFHFPFFIGKLKKNVDYCLVNDVVSRYHTKITKEDDTFFIMDLNSTNGTFLNGEALPTYQKKELRLGDEIALANIKFLFIRSQ